VTNVIFATITVLGIRLEIYEATIIHFGETKTVNSNHKRSKDLLLNVAKHSYNNNVTYHHRNLVLRQLTIILQSLSILIYIYISI
jgi:hypothetical protein